jgi:hypothetical protein
VKPADRIKNKQASITNQPLFRGRLLDTSGLRHKADASAKSCGMRFVLAADEPQKKVVN